MHQGIKVSITEGIISNVISLILGSSQGGGSTLVTAARDVVLSRIK